MSNTAIIAFLVAIMMSIVMHLSWRLRFIFFLAFIFLSLAKLPINIGFITEQTLRLPLAIILLMSGYKDVVNSIYKPLNPFSLLFLLLWTIYISVVWSISSEKLPQDLYEYIGNLIFFVIVVVYMQRMNSREFKILLIFIVLTRIPGLLINIPSVRYILERIGFYWGTTYHQAAGHSSVSLLPFLLLGVSTASKLRYKLLIWGLIAVTFYIVVDSGARSPALLFGLVLILWWRKIRYGIVVAVVILVAFQFYMSSMKTDTTEERYQRLFSVISTGDVTEAHNVEFRYDHLVYGFRALAKEPLFGHGYTSWSNIVGEEVGQIGYLTAPHNEPLRILVEYGVFGFSLFALFIYNCINKLKKKPSKDFWVTLSYAFFLAIVSHIAVNIFHNSLLSRYFFFICAVGSILPSILYRLEQDDISHKQRFKKPEMPSGNGKRNSIHD